MYDRQYYFLVRHNEEKVIYFLLLGRKERQPSTEDQTQAISSHHHNGNTHSSPSSAPSSSPSTWCQILRGRELTLPRRPPPPLSTSTTEDVPIPSALLVSSQHTHTHTSSPSNQKSPTSEGLDSTSSTRQTRVNSVATPTYNPSAAGYYTYSSSTPPSSRTRKTSYAPGDTAPSSLTLPVGHLHLLEWLHLNPLPPFTAWCFATATGVTMETKVVSDDEDLHGVATVSPPTPGRSS